MHKYGKSACCNDYITKITITYTSGTVRKIPLCIACCKQPLINPLYATQCIQKLQVVLKNNYKRVPELSKPANRYSL